MGKNILAIVGSPRIGGNTELLTDAFIKGALENGHTAQKILLGKIKVNGCTACGQCYKNGVPCVQNDGMQQIYPLFDKANIIVWASPLYYRQFSAQLMAVINRLHPISHPDVLSVPFKECVLLMAGATEDESMFAPAVDLYQFSMINYPKWKDLGMILARGVRAKGAIVATDALCRAWDLGKSV